MKNKNNSPIYLYLDKAATRPAIIIAKDNSHKLTFDFFNVSYCMPADDESELKRQKIKYVRLKNVFVN